MNDAISTIALGVDTKSGKQHLTELRDAFASLKREVQELNQLRSNPDALAGGAGKASSLLTTLTAELQKTKQQVSDLQNQLASLSKSQVDNAQQASSAIKAAADSQARSVMDAEKRAAAETQRLARETTKVVEDEARKRYSMSMSAKVGSASYSFKQGASEDVVQKQILAKMLADQQAYLAKQDALRAASDAKYQASLIESAVKDEAVLQRMLREQEEYLVRKEALEKEGAAIHQRLMLESSIKDESTLQKMLREQEEYLAKKSVMEREAEARHRSIMLESAAKDAAVAAEAAAAAQKDAERRIIQNNTFNTSSLRSQVNTAGRAKGLVDAGRADLARELYGDAAVAAVSNLEQMQAKLNSSVSKGGSAAKEAAKQTEYYTHTLHDAHSAARGLAGGLGQLWLTWGNIVPLVAGAAVTGSMVKVFTAGKDVEFQLQFLRALASDLEREPIQLDNFLKITDGTMSSVKEAAEGMRALAQAGLNQKQALRSLPDVLNLAAIGEMQVGAAALTATGVVEAFGLRMDDISRVGDVFARIAASSNTSVQGMTESMKQASTVGEMFHVSLEETAASVGVLAQRNIIGTSAGTSLTNSLKNLYEPTEKAKKALKELNITTDDGSGGLKNYSQLMGELAQKLSTLNDSSKAVFLGTITDQRGAKTLSAITENFGKYKEFLDQAKDSTGFMSKAVLELEDTVEGSTRRIRNSMEASFIKAFDEASPSIRQVMTEMNGLAKSEELVSMLSHLAIAGANVTRTFVENIGVIGAAIGVYAGLRVTASLSNGYLVWRTATLAATTATTANTVANAANAASMEAVSVASATASVGVTRFAAAARLAAGAFGPLSIIAMALYTAYELWNSSIDKNQSQLLKANNTIDTTLDYYDRQIAKLDELNKQLKDSGTNAESAANKTAKATLQAALVVENDRIKQMEGSQRSGLTAYGRTSAGNVVNNMPTRVSPDLREAYRNRDSLQNRLQELERKELTFSDRRDENLALTSRKRVSDRIDHLIESAGGGLFKGGTEASRRIVPVLEAYKKELDSDEAAYLRIAPLLADAEKRINESKNTYKPVDTKSANDAYKAAQAKLDGELQAIKRGEKSSIGAYESLNKQGELGDLQKISAELAIVTNARERELDVFKRKETLAASQEHRKKDEQAILNKEAEMRDGITEAEKKANEQRAEVFSKYKTEELMLEADTLKKRGQLVDAFKMQYEAKFRADLKKVESDLQVPGLTDEDKARLQQRREYLIKSFDIGTKSNLFEETKAQYDALLADMREKIEKVTTQDVGRAANLTNGFANDLGAAQMADDIRSQAMPALEALRNKLAQIAEQLKDNKLKAEVSTLGRDLAKEATRSTQAWIAAAKSIEQSLSNAFGKAGKSVGQIVAALIKQKAVQDELNDDVRKAHETGDSVKIIKAETRAREEGAQAQIATYGEIAGAAKGFFDEHSKGYKILQAAEQAFRAFELAQSIAVMTAKLTETQTTSAAKLSAIEVETAANAASVAPNVAADGAKASASGIAAVAKTLASLPFPFNLVAGGIVLASLLRLGVAMTGGVGGGNVNVAEERQKQQGTGTVLGDEHAKSGSIGKSIEALKDNSDIALRYSSGMLSSLKVIESNISGMAVLVARTPGLRGTRQDIQGLNLAQPSNFVSALLGGKRQTLLDTGISVGNQTLGEALTNGINARSYAEIQTTRKVLGITVSNRRETRYGELDQDLKDQFTLVLRQMVDGITGAAQQLGRSGADVRRELEAMNIALTEVSFNGLTGEQIQTELEAIFSSIGDGMANIAMASLHLEDFQRAGEGFMQTAMRVASGVEAAAYQLDQLGIAAVTYTEIANKQGDVTTEILRDSIVASETTANTLQLTHDNIGGIVTDLMTWAQSVRVSGIGQIVSEFQGTASELVETYRTLVDIRRQLTAGGLNGDNLSRDTIRGAGGLDNLRSGASTYIDRFFTDAEKHAMDVQHLTEEFQHLGYTLPATKEAFRTLLRTVDDGSESGNRLVGRLLNLADAFADLTDYADDLTNSLNTQRHDLQAQALDLAGDAAGARAIRRRDELASLDASLRPLQQRVYLLEDEKDALDKANDALDEAKSTLQSAFDEAAGNLEKTRDRFKEIGKTLRELRESLLSGDLTTLSPEAKYRQMSSKFDSTYTLALSGDPDAGEKLADVSREFLQASREYNASSTAYATDFDRVQSALESVAAGADNQVSIAQQSLDLLKQQLRGIIDVHDAVISVEQALRQYNAALSARDTIQNTMNANAASVVSAGSAVASSGPATPTSGPFTLESSIGGAGSGNNNAFYHPSGVNVANGDSALVAAAKIVYQSATSGVSTAQFNNAQSLVGGDIFQKTGWNGDPSTFRARWGFAEGGVFRNGIVSQPTYFNTAVMGEKDPEAIMPLVRTAQGLGVRAVGGGTSDADLAELKMLMSRMLDLLQGGMAMDGQATYMMMQKLDKMIEAAGETTRAVKQL